MENEIKAVQEFLSNYVTPFFGNRLRPNVLKQLVHDADVLNIDADPEPYVPVKVDENDLLPKNANDFVIEEVNYNDIEK